jgi:flavodoxin
MTRYLVVYYSWTGNTKRVAKAVADCLGADLEEIVEERPFTGPFARFLHALDSIVRRKPPIAPSKHDVGDYDVVIFGSPVWAAEMAAPMRSFLAREKGRVARAAFFCTQSGLGGETALAGMADATGAEPLSILLLNERQLEAFGWRSIVDKFAQSIENAVSMPQHSGETVGESRPESPGLARTVHDEGIRNAPR